MALCDYDPIRARLEACGVDFVGLEKHARAIEAPVSVNGDPPFTSTAKRGLELALRESLTGKASGIEPMHVLLAILEVPASGAVGLLQSVGASAADVHTALRGPTEDAPRVDADNQALAGASTDVGTRERRLIPSFADVPHEGARIGEYKLIGSVIAAPTYPGKAWVWRAAHVETGNECVLKLYPLDEPDPRHRARRETEARLGERWSRYREVVTTHYWGESDGFFVIALRSMGETLEEHIARRGRGEAEWCDATVYTGWLRSIGAVLLQIHLGGDLHRDVTARNVLLERDGTRVRLSDFSIGSDGQSGHITEAGEFLGTRGEVAPEHYRNVHSQAGDQYQLAYVAWLLLTGEAYPMDSGERLTRPMRAVLERALAVDPAHRYPDSFSFVAELDASAKTRLAMPVAAMRFPHPALRRASGRLLPLLVFAGVIFGWSAHQARVNGSAGASIPPAISGLTVLCAVLFMEVVVLVQQRVAAVECRRLVTVARSWAALGVAAPAGLLFADALATNSGQFLHWLLPWLAAALCVLVQIGFQVAPAYGEGKHVRALAETLAGARGRPRMVGYAVGITAIGVAVCVLLAFFIRTR